MSDEVSNFLRSVEQLNHRRDDDDGARARELEEKILQQRRERQARREERARSISPQKSSPANTPPPSARRRDPTPQIEDATASTIPDLSAALQNHIISSPTAEPMDRSPSRSASPTKETEISLDFDLKRSSGSYASPPNSAGLSRTPTLSWQRRPPSQGPGPRSRPLSMVAAENAAVRSSTPPAEANSPTDQAPSRDQISQALGSKDPSWFRQTADRGASSAAYRKNQVEDADTVDVSSGHAQLPGMSRSISTEPGRTTPSSRPSSQVGLKAGSPLLADVPKLGLGPPADIQEGKDSTGSGRNSPTRPPSPTKGMGGFVQSAMMKRTDSVKRWSVTTPGLQRGNTVANRNSYDNKNGGTSPGLEATNSRPVSRGRDDLSRPTSSHAKDKGALTADAGSLDSISASPKPDLPKPEAEAEKTPPTSPSRTMDPRRWSPSKGSSWLDAALKQPESPKPKPAAAPSNQPAWMVELNRAKAERAKNPSVDLGRGGSTIKRHEVKTGGLVRPAPPGTAAKPPGLTGLTGLKSPPLPTEKPLTPGLRSGGFNKSPVSDKPSPWTPPIAISGEPERRSSIANPAPGKDKADTPPVKDFRANLRPRGTTVGNVDKGQPVNELANVFGNLRKAKTQNYVAPDELKDNILKGKSALNLTGGPRPYEKKDEFKDAILKKKADFSQAKQEGRGVTPAAKPQQEEPVPEAIRRRATISRSKSISHSRNTSLADSAADSPRTSEISPPTSRNPSQDEELPQVEKKPEPAAPSAALTAAAAATTTATEETPPAPGRLPNKIGGSALANRFNPALAGLLARGPPGAGGAAPKSAGASSGTGVTDAGNEPGPGPQLTHMTKNRARGPRRKAPAAATSQPVTATPSASAAAPAATTSLSLSDAPKEVPVKQFEDASASSPSPPLQADKQPLPTPTAAAAAAVVEKPPVKQSTVVSAQSSSVTSPVVSPVTSPIERFTGTMAEGQPRSSGVISLVDSSKKRLNEQRPTSTGTRIALVDSSKPKPPVSAAAPTNSNKIHEQVAALAAKAQKPEEKKVEEPLPPRSPSPRKLDSKRMSKFLDEQQPESKTAQPEPPRSPSPVKRTFGATAAAAAATAAATTPQKQPDSEKNGTVMFGRSLTPVKPQPKQEDKPVVPAEKPLPEKPAVKAVPAPLDLRPESPSKTFASRTILAERNAPSNFSPLASPTRSPSKSGADVTNMLKDFFGSERPERAYRVDAGEVLMNRPNAGQIVQTHKVQLFQVTEQGKRVPVPSHYERVLFEREMYICSHSFTNAARKKMQEVYFWVGDEVAPSAVEDAQVFVNREARALGGTLIQLRQGKETAEFIQALGGIIIIRRGSSNKYDSLASNMLCGRNFAGQIVFDEVDFNPLSLCSGFPYIITQSGKCYLWKGKGAGVDELSCARLIGMDSALMGELLEIEEGKEPDNFWELFDGKKKMSSADHWRLKPSYDKYCGRLFCSDAADRRQIMEISPFSQTDLSASKIYVLDAFFEMYIIVGRNAQAEYASFHNALDFAQEYAILAAGMEDRPFVPVSTVVLEGIPRDLRSCFRKWRDELSPTRTVAASSSSSQPLSAGGGGVGGRPSPLRRARSLKIVSLGQALQALGGAE